MPKCRDCPKRLRERCIQESNTSASVKMMMRRAFEAGTDTEDLWGLLQMNCLQLPRQQMGKSRSSALGRRLKSESKPIPAIEEIDVVTPPPPPAHRPTSSPTLPQTAERVGPADHPVSPPVSATTYDLIGESARAELGVVEKEVTTLSQYYLSLQDGQRRIALPANGELVLGRFDPTINITPDVDLSYDDRESRVISRRHARIVGHNGRHEVEDLGSTNGTMVNSRKLTVGQRVQLRSGDRVTLGSHEFTYGPHPDMQVSPFSASPSAYLQVTFTGRRFPLPSLGEMIIGRSDRVVGLTPDIDLGEEAGVAQVVARRHAKIIARNGRHYVEDLGSAGGTKLNGVPVEVGQLGPLNPGDHIWLGGCVLAYDVER
jgi:pSer/pThr/pTyr-binding forkhead associated (FHA) protein